MTTKALTPKEENQLRERFSTIAERRGYVEETFEDWLADYEGSAHLADLRRREAEADLRRREAELFLRELVKDADDLLEDPGTRGTRQEEEARNLRRIALDRLNELERKNK